MRSKFKFIHMADLHLGSILHIGKKVNSTLAELFNNAVFNAFKKLCDTAIKEDVNFILISGDIYDREARSVKGNNFFIEQCRRLHEAGIMVYTIGGNHDPIKQKNELFNLPSNVYILSSEEVEVKEVKDVTGSVYARVIGQSYKESWDSRKMYESYAFLKKEVFNIALLHTQLDNNNNYVPCSAADLKKLDNIDYWALGHIHKFRIINKSNPFIAYPGIPQGRDSGEEGVGGGLLVEVEDNKLSSIKFIPVSEVIWEKLDINVSDNEYSELKNISDLENIIILKAEELLSSKEVLPEGIQSFYEDYSELIKGYIVQWSIKGRGNLYDLVNERTAEVSDYLIESLNNKFINGHKFLYTDFIDVNVGRPIENLEGLKKQNSTLKEISKVTQLLMKDETMKAELIKRLGSIWEVTDSYEDINSKKLQLDHELLETILIQAEQLAMDAILERGEEL